MNRSMFFTSESERPKGEHWAIIELRHITIPGDERSRQAPGHGYPEHTTTVVNYEYFTNEEDFRQELEKRFQRTYSRERIVGLHVAETFSPKVIISAEKDS